MEQFLEDIKNLEVTTVARAQEKLQLSLLDVKLVLTAVNLQVHWLVLWLKRKHISTSLTAKSQVN